jgi:hypothetical protein
MTGIYIDSLWQLNSQNVKFQLSGNNLNPANETQLINALRHYDLKESLNNTANNISNYKIKHTKNL